MLRNFFWLVLGGGLVVLAIVKGRQIMKRSTPQALAQRAQASAASLGDQAADFIASVRQAAAEREAELREALALDADPARD